MARPLRVEYLEQSITSPPRGNEKKNIFRSNCDRELFLNVLRQIIDRFHWLCHSYVLMSNHYHLLIETPEPTLSRGMRQLNGVYTQEFNRIHRRVGHLFQGRFKAVLIEKDGYLLEVSRYIVLNPVRSGLVKRPEEWKWSSFRAIAGLAGKPDFLELDWIRSQFGKDGSETAKEYIDFVMRGTSVEYPVEALSGTNRSRQ